MKIFAAITLALWLIGALLYSIAMGMPRDDGFTFTGFCGLAALALAFLTTVVFIVVVLFRVEVMGGL